MFLNLTRKEILMHSTGENVMNMEITTEGTPSLVVRGHSGDITIEQTYGSTIRIHADHFEDGHDTGEEPLITSQSGNQVTIDTHRNHAMLQADLKIGVPIGTAVTANTIDGDIGVHATHGPVELSTVGGDIRLDHAQGLIKLTTVAGDVQGDHLDGTLTLQTTNGDVKIRDSNLRRFNVHSVNGDFVIETPLTRGEHYFAKTTNGDIQLWIPSDTGATVQMHSTNGDFHSDLRTEIINPSRRHWQGRINGGGANVELETLNGDVQINTMGTESFTSRAAQRPEVPDMPDIPDLPDMPTMPDMPELPNLPDVPDIEGRTGSETESYDGSESATVSQRPDYSSADSIGVLARLERGEITVEEAMEELDELR
jgi:hypothetical protein